MDVKERLQALREQMRKRKIVAYIVPTEDFHGSEYVGDYFKTREYLSGFTGSAGTLLVCRNVLFCGRTADIFCRRKRSCLAAVLN